MAQFPRHLLQRDFAQLDLFASQTDYVLGPREVHPFSGSVSWTATWKGEYAGDIFPCPEDPSKFEAHADLGYLLFGHGAGSTHSHYLGEFDTLEEAAEAHEKRTREVRSDPSLIWSCEESPENVRKAKAKGWWNRDKVKVAASSDYVFAANEAISVAMALMPTLDDFERGEVDKVAHDLQIALQHADHARTVADTAALVSMCRERKIWRDRRAAA